MDPKYAYDLFKCKQSIKFIQSQSKQINFDIMERLSKYGKHGGV